MEKCQNYDNKNGDLNVICINFTYVIIIKGIPLIKSHVRKLAMFEDVIFIFDTDILKSKKMVINGMK